MENLQDSEVLANPAPFNVREFLTNLVEVFRSRQLVVLVTLLIGLVAEGLLLAITPRTYQAVARVLIVGGNTDRAPSVSSVDLPSVATSTVVLERVLDDLKIPLSVIDLKKTLKPHVADRSSIMDISYEDESPDRAVSVPNAVADELVRYYRFISTNQAEEDVRMIDLALDGARRRLNSITNQLGALTAQYPFLGADKPLDTLSGRLDALEQQRATALATLSGDRSAAQATAPNSKAMTLIARNEILTSDQLYGQLQSGAAKDAAQLRFEQATFSDRYPDLQILRAKVQAERTFVQEEQKRRLASTDAFSPSRAQSMLDNSKALALVNGDRTRVFELDSLISMTHTQLQQYQDAGSRFAWLSVQRDAAQADYLGLSNRRTAAIASRAESLSTGSVVVVDRAVRASTTVVGFGRVHLAVVSTLVVVLLALCTAPLAEMIDPRLRRAEQIEKLYGSTLITTLGTAR